MTKLTFKTLREVNVARCTEGWKHPLDGWTADEWLIAVGGEMGEALNVVKKLNRARDNIIGNDKTTEELRGMLADELADTAIYLDLLLASVGLPFTAINKRLGISHILDVDHRFRGGRGSSNVPATTAALIFLGTLANAPSPKGRMKNCQRLLGCLDGIAFDFGIDLAAAIVSKFNRTSEKHGMPHRLPVEA